MISLVVASPVWLALALPPEEEAWATITVAGTSAPRVLPPAVELAEDALRERQPRSAAETLKGLAGVSIRPNSRGETIARVRGSEERQTQIFLDGAPLSVPWDGRVDLGAIPAGLIGAVRVAKGAAPLEYGANAVAGAVDFETRSGGPANFRAQGSVGTFGYGDLSAVATLPVGRVDLTFAAAGLTRDAEPVARRGALPFSQPGADRRVNTDVDAGSVFAAARYADGPLSLRAYLLHVSSERGIAPESDRDPRTSNVRYWRYPDASLTQASVTSEVDVGPRSVVKLTAWRQWYGQRIDQFSDVTYSRLSAGQADDDDTLGGRLVVSTGHGPVDLRLVGTALTSRHAQVDSNAAGVAGPRLVYRQNLYTLGAEADVALGRAQATFGVAYDRSSNPRTGDKPAQPSKDALAFSAALRAPLADDVTLTLSGGRRNRFPSARELFAEALGRFLPNPGLKPERAWLVDAELRWVRPDISVTLNPFLIRAEDTVAQRVVRVNGRNLRQRYNVAGSTSYGVDLTAAGGIAPGLDFELAGSVLRARADTGSAAFRRLVQRPSYELYGALDWAPVAPLLLRGEVRQVAAAVDLGPAGEKARLAPGTEVNVRARVDLGELAGGARLYLTGSVDNVFDDVITPQLGLPLPGRAFRIGFQIG
jgi:iron complex outermembrane receptor protein